MSTETKLFTGCEKGDIDQVRVLVSQGAQLNAHDTSWYDYTPLHYAAA